MRERKECRIKIKLMEKNRSREGRWEGRETWKESVYRRMGKRRLSKERKDGRS